MRKRVQIAVAVVVVAVVGVAVWQWLRERQTGPVYRGKRLDYWLRQYAEQTPKGSEATNAFRQLGERAVPWLVQRLEAPDPFGSWYLRICDGYEHYLPKFLADRLPESHHIETRLAALNALAMLAPSAHSAMTAIINALTNEDVEIGRTAALALGTLGPVTSNVVPALVSAMTTNLDWYEEGNAMYSLGVIRPVTTNAISALVNAMKNGRCEAAEALGNMGPSGASAALELLTAIRSADMMMSEAASTALLKIDPEAAAKAGVK
jgi:HEAT repeat protein